jgi:hypothetical protein
MYVQANFLMCYSITTPEAICAQWSNRTISVKKAEKMHTTG